MSTLPPRVLVTGAGGFLGAAVTRRLHDDGMQVLAHLGPPGVRLVEPPAGVTTARADILDPDAVRELCRRADLVVHLAGPPSVAASFRDPVGCVRTHVEGTAHVLAACREVGVRRLVHVSSAEVYGYGGATPVVETGPTSPRSPYGAAKLSAEVLVRSLAGRDGLEGVVLRPFSVYGPGSPPTSLVGSVLQSVVASDRVEVASFDTERDYVHVDDVAVAVSLALTVPVTTVPVTTVPVYNVASGRPTSVRDLVDLVLEGAGRRLPVVQAQEPDRPRAADLLRLVGDVSRARDELGWAPRVPLREGLAAAVRQRRAAGVGADGGEPRAAEGGEVGVLAEAQHLVPPLPDRPGRVGRG